MKYARLEIYRTESKVASQQWGWRLISRNGKLIACGGEGYARPSAAEAAALEVIEGGYSLGTDETKRIVRIGGAA